MKSRFVGLVFVLSVAATAQTIVGLDAPKPTAPKPTPQATAPIKETNELTKANESGAAAVPASSPWGRTKWGMTKAELEAAYPGKITTANRILGGKKAGGMLPMLPEFSVTGTLNGNSSEVKFKVFFVIDEKKGLQTIYLDSLTPDDEKGLRMAFVGLNMASSIHRDTATERCGDVIYKLLEDKYGKPIGGKEVLILNNEWLLSETKLSFSKLVCTLVYEARNGDSGL